MATEPPEVATADDVATVAEPASTRAREGNSGRLPERTSTGGSSTRVTSVVTPRETLHLQEISRTRVFVTVILVFDALVLCAVGFLGGDPLAKGIFVASLAALLLSCGWLALQLRRDDGYTVARATFAAYVAILTGFAGIWFFGVFSPAAMVLPFGIAFFAVGQSAGAVRSVYVTCAVLELVLQGFVVGHVLADRGIVRADGVRVLDAIVIMGLAQGTLLATFVVQRRTRAATLDAIEQHDHVVRSLAQRDALLREARQELAAAMQPGGEGRWTDEVLGSFRLGHVLGRGAMGEVYEAVHVTTGEPAAVKLLHPHVLAQSELVERFVREARIVSRLTAPNVVRVLEVSGPESRVPYLAMERLTGTDLADYLREHKRMSGRAVVAMLRQVGAGLEAAHAAGVVHRDLKPRNLFLTRPGGDWKILDFGVARVAGEETLTIDQIVGTPNYMAPEQASGRPVTPRTDLFALGVIVYRVMTGRPAFEGESTAEIIYKVVHAMPPRPTAVASIPEGFDSVLAIALAKDPGDRFETAQRLADAADAAVRGELDAALLERAGRLLGRLPWADA